MSSVTRPSQRATHALSISVVFPVRNQKCELQSRIESLINLLSQRADQFEILIIDDHSSDGTPQQLDKFQLRFPQIRSMRLGHGKGPKQSFAIALDHARGDIIVVNQTYESIDQSHLAQMLELKSDPRFVYARAIIDDNKVGDNKAGDNKVGDNKVGDNVDEIDAAHDDAVEENPNLLQRSGSTWRSSTRSRRAIDRLEAWGENLSRSFQPNSPASYLHIFRRSAVELIRNGQINLKLLTVTHSGHDSITKPYRVIDPPENCDTSAADTTLEDYKVNQTDTGSNRFMRKSNESILAIDAPDGQFRPISTRQFSDQLKRMQIPPNSTTAGPN